MTNPSNIPPGSQWRIRLSCCGRDDGVLYAKTWEEADQMREDYTSGPGVHENGYSAPEHASAHRRAAIVESLAPTPPAEAQAEPAASSESTVRELCEELYGAGYAFWDACRIHEGGGAIRWVQYRDGTVIVFTRGEYREQLLDRIAQDYKAPTTVFEAPAEDGDDDPAIAAKVAQPAQAQGEAEEYPVIRVGFGKVEFGDAEFEGLPALWFGNKGAGMGVVRVRNAEADPGETIACMTFANAEGFAEFEKAVARVKAAVSDRFGAPPAPPAVEPDTAEYMGLPFVEAKARILEMPQDVAQQFAISLLIQNGILKKYEPALFSAAAAPQPRPAVKERSNG